MTALLCEEPDTALIAIVVVSLHCRQQAKDECLFILARSYSEVQEGYFRTCPSGIYCRFSHCRNNLTPVFSTFAFRISGERVVFETVSKATDGRRWTELCQAPELT